MWPNTRKSQITDNPLVANNVNILADTLETLSPPSLSLSFLISRIAHRCIQASKPTREEEAKRHRSYENVSTPTGFSCVNVRFGHFQIGFVCGFGLSTQHKKCIPNFSLLPNNCREECRPKWLDKLQNISFFFLGAVATLMTPAHVYGFKLRCTQISSGLRWWRRSLARWNSKPNR